MDNSQTVPLTGECHVCGKETDRKCSDCRKDWYCSESCQKARSTLHVFECSPGRPLNTADYLYLAIIEDRFPDDSQTREDYGFARTSSFVEEIKLFSLYKGLNYGDVTSQEVHQWHLEGSLVQRINESYLRYPQESRGEYHPWFMKNQHLLDGSKNFDDSDQSKAERMVEEARLHLVPEDRTKHPNELQPNTKREGFFFFAMALQRAHPPPNHTLYYKFGFCICTSEREENSLGGLYSRLLAGDKDASKGYLEWSRMRNIPQPKTCTFSEFWQAYAKGKLTQLFDSKGLREERLQFKHLETFLAVAPNSGGMQPSVWDLNGFLACKEDLQAPNPVLVDYGFMNCDTVLEKLELKRFYEKLLAYGDPLDLHEACVRGEIYDYATRVLGNVESQFRPLVQNPYPLARDTDMN